ncbi:hypothetical protein ASPCAL11637 [Aspergillus calidoustus]|uniref:Protein kinase domain-containing protein n=1 Tax=Aspergillus calidoustus TaxID=454130 RepID=A0A0U5GCZ9_ASPCI|nr:hypothetical protein ASPCAL11637 [Aspergillus calidoustus]
MDDTDFIFKPSLTSWNRDDNSGASAVPVLKQGHIVPTVQSSILEFLSIAQALNIDILPITWQPALPTIGEGATAYVLQSPFAENARFAFKRMRPVSQEEKIWNMRALIAELLILGQPSIRTHPCISPLQGICWDVSSMTDEVCPVLVFGKANNGDLGTFMASTVGPRLSYFSRVAMCFQMGDAIRTMHELGVVHGDIKPQNVLVFGGRNTVHFVRISDFGYSTLFAKLEDKILMPQTPPWIAPEYHKGQAVDRAAAQKMDVYSFGLLCLWLLFYNVHVPSPSTFYDDIKSGTLPLALAIQKVENLHDKEQRNAIREFFTHSICPSPEDRCSNFSDMLKYLGTGWYFAPILELVPMLIV